ASGESRYSPGAVPVTTLATMSANPVSAAATVKSRDLPITGRCRRISSAIPMAMSCSMPALSSAIGRTIRSQPRSSSEDRSKPKGMASRVLTRMSAQAALSAQSPCRLPRSGFVGGLPEAQGQHPDSTRLGGLGPHGVGGHVAAAVLAGQARGGGVSARLVHEAEGRPVVVGRPAVAPLHEGYEDGEQVAALLCEQVLGSRRVIGVLLAGEDAGFHQPVEADGANRAGEP